MSMSIKQLSQYEADRLMKSLNPGELYYRNWFDAFHDERKRTSDRNQLWAFPEEERSYYLIESYLFGVNFQNPDLVSLSSFALVFPRNPSHNCGSCLKVLLQQKLIPFCRDHKKRCISAALTEGGRAVFEDLKKDFPGLQFMRGGLYDLATIPCAELVR